ncbi:MAG: M13 family metallopeptidase, partial [Pseudomonadota bacterium]
RSSYGAFHLLGEKSQQQTRFIIEDLAAEAPAANTPSGKVAAFFNAFMDVDAINEKGMAPAEPYLKKIDRIRNRRDLAKVFATPGYSSPLSPFIFTDDKDPETYIFQMYMGGLGLPDREYYLKDDEKSVEQREQYVSLLTSMLEHAGEDNAADKAAAIMALETEIAKADWDRALSRNPELTYNKLSIKEFNDMAGDFPLSAFMRQYGAGNIETLLAGEIPPTAEDLEAAGLTDEDAEKLGDGLPRVFELAQNEDLDTWKAYLKAHFLIDHASVLPTEIDNEVFAFYGTTLRGTPEQRPRWKRAVSATENALGEAIGAAYVERHFPPANKAAMDELVANLRKAMAANLADLEWMGEETKVLAVDKLEKFNPKVGYPEEFETYASMNISDNALANAMEASKFNWQEGIDRLGTDVDKNEWFMTPQTVNAYYNPAFNEIVFPAAILQPPFFNISADPAVNYGAIGGVIGHEMGHGFDDQGSKYDGDGVLRNWWTDEDLAAFRELTSALAAQYDQFCPLGEGEPCVNGKLSLGENIGDLGGLSLAYRAYKLSLNGEEAPVIDGFTGDQRFFMAWAQVWRTKVRDEAMRTHLLTGPHSPGYYRSFGPVRNIDAWYDAFGVTEDDELYLPPEERVSIW